MKRILFKLVSKMGDLTEKLQNFHSKNYKTMLKEREDLNKYKDIPYSLMERLNTKMTKF